MLLGVVVTLGGKKINSNDYEVCVGFDVHTTFSNKTVRSICPSLQSCRPATRLGNGRKTPVRRNISTHSTAPPWTVSVIHFRIVTDGDQRGRI